MVSAKKKVLQNWSEKQIFLDIGNPSQCAKIYSEVPPTGNVIKINSIPI
jgi:hypothetical protein